MVSDVETAIMRVEKEHARKPSDSASEKKAGPISQTESRGWRTTAPNPRGPVSPSSGGSPAAKQTIQWLLGLGALVGLFWLVGNSGRSNIPDRSYDDIVRNMAAERSNSGNGSAPSASEYLRDAPASMRTTSESALQDHSPVPPRAPGRPSEVKPPTGRNNVLTQAQIRYCLAEQIRIDAAEAIVSEYSESDVDQFNELVNDYNSRCGQYRYRAGSLENARAEVEPHRASLQAEGRGRFVRHQSSGRETMTPEKKRALEAVEYAIRYGAAYRAGQPLPRGNGEQAEQAEQTEQTEQLDAAARIADLMQQGAVTDLRPKPDPTVAAIQQRLNELGYDAGIADGLMGAKTRSAIAAFQSSQSLPVDGRADIALLERLGAQTTVETPDTASPPRKVPRSSEAQHTGGTNLYRYVDQDGFIHYTDHPTNR